MKPSDEYRIMLGEAFEAIRVADAARTTDWTNLWPLAGAFAACDKIQIEGYYHRGKLLAWAQSIIYLPENAEHLVVDGKKRTPDYYYGKWQKDNITVSTSQARNYLSFYQLAEAGRSRLRPDTDLKLLPNMQACRLLMSEKTPEEIQKKVISKIKKGEAVTVKEVKGLLGKPKEAGRSRARPDPETSEDMVAISIENPNWHAALANFTNEQLLDLVEELKAQNIIGGQQ